MLAGMRHFTSAWIRPQEERWKLFSPRPPHALDLELSLYLLR